MARVKTVACPLCGGQMKRATTGSCSGAALGCFVILLGLILGIVLFPLGLLLTVPLFVVGLFCGGKPVWRCKQCGHMLPRAQESFRLR